MRLATSLCKFRWCPIRLSLRRTYLNSCSCINVENSLCRWNHRHIYTFHLHKCRAVNNALTPVLISCLCQRKPRSYDSCGTSSGLHSSHCCKYTVLTHRFPDSNNRLHRWPLVSSTLLHCNRHFLCPFWTVVATAWNAVGHSSINLSNPAAGRLLIDIGGKL